jgi:hypothetical protein
MLNELDSVIYYLNIATSAAQNFDWLADKNVENG